MGPEWIIVGIISLFGIYQYDRAEDAIDRAEAAEMIAERSISEARLAEQINEDNNYVIDDLEARLSTCSERYKKTIDKINDFERVQQADEVNAQALESDIADSEFGACVVPDGVSLSR